MLHLGNQQKNDKELKTTRKKLMQPAMPFEQELHHGIEAASLDGYLQFLKEDTRHRQLDSDM